MIGRECGCEQHVKIFQSMGIWIENGTIVPKPGDIILYNWDQSYQPNNGYSDHIGFVESVSNGQITCIEGNKGEAVARRVLSVGNGNIRGYARPKYSGAGTAPSNPVTPPVSGGDTPNKNVAWYGVVNTGTLNVRTWAGTENPQLKSYPTISTPFVIKMVMLGIRSRSKETRGKSTALLRQHILQSSLPASRMQIQPFQMMA